ncbi:UvrD-helicase domain-containing protein [Corynebacterium heidelbergense]|uniref:DNA 3'-5' helicase n=1 Tax=Corynebacterium heidelbergense TaxID=2055947 RepID=A0A364V9X2_9CORY|nr:UvrD-helicase domain-containing protein [Corynebacterium heidelbergense]RAV33366.1 DNA helicase UvrD [Corynebacterium heidelbergense]WCZ37164.1 ATP-dependent DNA helicase UvrD1 [Corynebacterium heidelbergense]
MHPEHISGPGVTPERLSKLVGQKHPPTPEQAAVISAPPTGNYLVVAGAGAGKTETMAARVVWLVANGYVNPENVLGLTFTRKAATELRQRIRSRLQALANSEFMQDLPAEDPRRAALQNIAPAVSTYDSYAGTIVREYGLLIPVEPATRIITEAERWILLRDVALEWQGRVRAYAQVPELIKAVKQLSDEMDNHLIEPAEVAEETQSAIDELLAVAGTAADGVTPKLNQDNEKFLTAQRTRLELLPVVAAYRARLDELQLMTFSQQMTKAAQLVVAHPQVGEAQRRRFHVVMLDEYQDTGHAQRVFLRSLYGQGSTPAPMVTAVGDPMQSIYGFRGATASNLENFRTDFPVGDEPARKLELTTSFRNPAGVLDLANEVSAWSMEVAGMRVGERPVSPLTAGPNAQEAQINVGFFDEREQELDWLADELARHWEEHLRAEGGTFSAAVLVRRNMDAPPIYAKLRERGVPAEMTAGPGLLDQPEVADVYATLRVLVDPTDDVAMLRLLTSPRWNIGAADLAVLSERTAQIQHRGSQVAAEPQELPAHLAGIDSPLAETLAELIPNPAEGTVGLAEAAADFSDAVDQGMSPAGAQRIAALAAELGYLRRHSLGKALPDLVADIERMIGMRVEVLTRWHADAESALGTSHLDRFAEVVRGFAEVGGTDPAALVDYLRAAHDQEAGLEPGEVSKRENTVQILTVHKAKGLEWDIVAVPHCDRSAYDDATCPKSARTWASAPALVPSALRGDADGPHAFPVLDTAEVGTHTDHKKAVMDFVSRVRAYGAKESDRVFYVAITRTQRVLLASGSAFSPQGGQGAKDPAVALTLLRNALSPDVVFSDPGTPPLAHPGRPVVHWSALRAKVTSKHLKAVEDGQLTREDELMFPSAAHLDLSADYAARRDAEAAQGDPDPRSLPHWPQEPLSQRDPDFAEAVALVTRADPKQAPASSSELAQQWCAETELLLEEHAAELREKVVVPLGARLTATEAVSLRRDEEEFARRRRRPVPLRPQPMAKRGTAFHNWVEQHYHITSLMDYDELPGASDASLQDPQLAELKRQFLASEWANRQPESVEGAYSVTIGRYVFEGRIDAVFHDATDPARGWLVLDWKTGSKPGPAEMPAAIMQLAVYRLAWARVLSAELGVHVPEQNVRAAFHYVKANETFEPDTLPDAEELERLIDG